MTSHATDPGSRRVVRVRCIHERFGGAVQGCGWTGSATEIAELGTTSLLPESCLECGGKIEVYREDR